MKRGLWLLGVLLAVSVIVFGTSALMTPVEAGKGGKGGGKCGDCGCVPLFPTPDGGVCVLTSCTLADKKTCRWDCGYDCS